MPQPAAPTAPEPSKEDLARRQREKVERLLAQPAVASTGAVVLHDGTRFDYRVSAGFIAVAHGGIEATRGEPEAAVYTIAYLKPDAAPAERPVCFAFNGGPGSSSVWLHLGAFGPKRVVVPDDGTMPAPPYAVSDNPLTWLEHFDLVFIDPPHTGWSLAASDDARKRMLSVDGDVDALADVVRGWLTRHKRWGSRVYLAGESYGTTRGAALADKLLDGYVALHGLVLVSCAMDLQTLVFAPRNDLPHALFLPAYANVAQYHGLLQGPLGASSDAARTAAEAFVEEDYLAALHAGARLGARRRAKVAKRMAELTGLPEALIEEKNLRVTDATFFFELLRARGLQVGRLDARSTGPLAASRGREFEFDPGSDAIASPYAMAAMAYFCESLGLDSEARYELLSMDVNEQWNWNRGEAQGNGYACTSGDLSRALRRNPHLRVFVASGRYDLGTPYSASDWSLAQLDVPPAVMQRVQHRYYDAGHMMYTREADLRKLKADLAGWLDAA